MLSIVQKSINNCSKHSNWYFYEYWKYLLFLSWWHELSVDDTKENVDNEEEKKFPADKLVQGSLHSQININFIENLVIYPNKEEKIDDRLRAWPFLCWRWSQNGCNCPYCYNATSNFSITSNLGLTFWCIC